MQKIVHLSKTNKVRGDEYGSFEDDETLLDKEGADIFAIKYTGKFRIESNNFVSFDSDVIAWLNNKLLKADVYRVFLMANTLFWEWSVVCDQNKKPYTSKSLATMLSMSLNKFYAMTRQLEELNIVYQGVCPLFGERKVYMMNPFIARKTKQLDISLLEIFSDVLKTGK